MTNIDFSLKSFLIIDDFQKFREVLYSVIRHCGGTNIEMATNGNMAISKMRERSFDIVICDYHLGDGKNGLQVLEQIKYEKLMKRTAIFMMVTAESGPDTVLGALEYMPDAYLKKPFNQSILRSRLNKAYSQKIDLAPIFEAIDNNDFNKAVTLCDEKAKFDIKYANQCYQIKADLYLERKDYAGAKEVFTMVLKNREIPWARLGIGKIYFLQDDYFNAMNTFEKIINENKYFLSAYDWLAKTKDMLGDDVEAEHILQSAINLSPKVIRRQQALGEIAFKLGDLDIAEEAYRKAVKLGKNSCFKSSNDYTHLVKTLITKVDDSHETLKRKAYEEILSVIKETQREYKKEKSVNLEVSLLESQTLNKLGQEQEAKNALNQAVSLFNDIEDELSDHLKADLMKTIIDMDCASTMNQLVKKLKSSGISEDVFFPKEHSTKDTSSLNTKGIKLYAQGKIKEAFSSFKQAIQEFPDNISYNLNAIQAGLELIEKGENKSTLMQECNVYLSHIKKIDQDNHQFERYQHLKEQYQSLK